MMPSEPIGHTHLRFDDNAQALLFRFSGLYRGISIHIDRGQVTVSACGGSLPRFRLRGEVGDDPSEVVRRFAREFVRRCEANAADPRYTPEWQNEWAFGPEGEWVVMPLRRFRDLFCTEERD